MRFVGNLICDIHWIFYENDMWRHLYSEHSESVQYFAQHFSFTTRQMLNSIVSYEKKTDKFNKQTCLNVKH